MKRHLSFLCHPERSEGSLFSSDKKDPSGSPRLRDDNNSLSSPVLRLSALILTLVVLALPAQAADKESAYGRVMKNQTIRCGYGTNKPWIWQDLRNGKMEGLNVRISEALAEQAGLKLDWAEETGWGELPQSLYDGRVDVACSLLWNDPARGRRVAFTQPLFYTAIYAWARDDDSRFTGNPAELNDPSIRISAQEGDITLALAKRFFPKAQLVTIPASAPWTDGMMSVITGKADITMIDSVTMAGFNAAQDKKMKKVPLPEPIAVYGNSLAVGIHETELKEVLDTAVAYILQTGAIDTLTADFRKEYPDAILLPKKPY